MEPTVSRRRPIAADGLVEHLTTLRATDPEAVSRALAQRPHRSVTGTLFLIAADHTARGVLAAGGDPHAMADRGELLRRLIIALERPGVDGVVATADIMEDLALLGALDGKIAVGTMNRGGLEGSAFELDDRFTAFTAERIARAGLNGGKMLLRIADDDPGTARTLEACARAVDALAERRLLAMIEVLAARRRTDGLTILTEPAAMRRAIAIASGLGATSAYTWLKLPPPGDLAVLTTTTLPVLLLGGDPGPDVSETVKQWRAAMALPQVRGLVVGRALLYPPDGDVADAVDMAAAIVRNKGLT